MSFYEGDRVIATNNLYGGVRKGDRGVITKVSGWGGITASFNQKEINVKENDIEKI